MVQREAVAGADGVTVAAAVLAVVGVVWLAPLLGVEGTVSTISDEIFVQEVSVEEFANIVGTIGARVAAVVASGGGTSSCALSCVKDTSEELAAYVGSGSVDGTNKFDRSVIAWDGVGWVVLSVTIGA